MGRLLGPDPDRGPPVSDLCSRSLRSASERHFIVHSKEAQNHFHRLLNEMFPPGGMTCKKASNTSLLYSFSIKKNLAMCTALS